MTSDTPEDIVMCGLGAVTALGRQAWSTAAAVRAGVTGFTAHPIMADVEGRPVHVAMCPWHSPQAPVDVRIADMLVPAIDQALSALTRERDERHSPVATACLVTLPLPRPGLPEDLSVRVQRAFAGAFPHVSRVAMAQRGHAGGILALRSAVDVLLAGRADACVVAGADSYLDLDTLEWLEETEQLHGAGARNNAWGYVPGEGAGAVLLLLAATADRLGLQPLARVGAVGVAAEPNLIRTGTVCLGLGLSAAFRQVFARLTAGRLVTDTYCDMNGEPYRAEEYGFAVIRTREHFESPSDFVAPADCWGDVGAASVPLFLSLAAIAFAKFYARGNLALIWAGSDSGERGATLLTSG